MEIENNWFMMVTTNNTDPDREDDFNAWYDGIDIPDVLEVPGYTRARRGKAQNVPGFRSAGYQQDEAEYAALYNIESKDIDKTIIAMLMASWKMEKVDRSTELLEVFERVYYRQYRPSVEAKQPSGSGEHRFLYLSRVQASRGGVEQDVFDEWYDYTFLPAVVDAHGVTRATRYSLYWVLMHDPPDIPGFLTVLEIQADTAAQAAGYVDAAMNNLREAGQVHPSYVEAGATVYLQIGDVGTSPQATDL